MTSIKILLLENIHPVAEQQLREAGYEVQAVGQALQGDELVTSLKGADVVGIRSKTYLTPEVLQKAPHLLAVGAFCIGTNQVALEAAAELGVPVFNAPFSNTRSVAELVLAEIVTLSRQLGDRNNEMHAGKWTKAAKGCYEVRGRTVGIVGYGHIGRQVGVLAEALGLRVLFFDIAPRLPMGNNMACASLEELLEQSDFVTLHVPATPQTLNMIGEAELTRMKRGSYLINASRGGVVAIPALADALRKGHLAGAAIDVFPEEPETNHYDDFRSPLQSLPNVFLTPHIGGSTMEAQEAIGREVSAALSKFLATGATTGAVNFPEAELALAPGAHRLVNVHQNVPGVLGNLNRIVSEHRGNILGQVLATAGDLGYLLMDLDRDIATPVAAAMAKLETTLRVRVV